MHEKIPSMQRVKHSNLSWGHNQGLWTILGPGLKPPGWYGPRPSCRWGSYHSGCPGPCPEQSINLDYKCLKLIFLLRLVHWTTTQLLKLVPNYFLVILRLDISCKLTTEDYMDYHSLHLPPCPSENDTKWHKVSSIAILLKISQIHKAWNNGKVLRYIKTCVKSPLSKRPKIVFQDQLLLNACQKCFRMLQGEHSAILWTFIKLPFVIRSLFCLFLGGHFTQLLLKTFDRFYNIL